MEGEAINRYRSYCRSLDNLADAKGRDRTDKFILSGTVQMFNLSFDLAVRYFEKITSTYDDLMEKFRVKAAVYYQEVE